MDPLTRGSLFHKVQAEFYRAMQERHALPVTPQSVPAAVDDARRDPRPRGGGLRGKARAGDRARLAATKSTSCAAISASGSSAWPTSGTWIPEYFEFSFGLNDEGRDPRSLPDPVTVDDRFILRGSVDLIERHAQTRRAARHRSQDREEPLEPGPDRRRRHDAAAGALQRGGRAGPRQEGRRRAPVLLHDRRRLRRQADRDQRLHARPGPAGARRSSIARSRRGFSSPRRPSAPARWCDFRPVCGPREEERVKRKAADRLADLAGAEVDAMTPIAGSRRRPIDRPRAMPSPTISTPRSSSKPRPAPARPPSWSSGSSGSWPPAGRRWSRSSPSPSPRRPRAS